VDSPVELVKLVTGQITQVTQQFSGPLPHPEILNRYDQIITGAAERILIMAEEDARHQRDIEKTAYTQSEQKDNNILVNFHSYN